METFDVLNVLKDGKSILKNAGIQDYEIEAEIILSNILKKERYRLWTDKTYISKKSLQRYFSFIKKRSQRIPFAYITKHVFFWKYKFKITTGVFIPRPETELIIETAKQIFHEKTEINILDVCTGCGILAICLAKEFPRSKVIATDMSRKSLGISKKNAESINVLSQIKFFQCNLFPSDFQEKRFYDLIVSNPPYISKASMKELQKEVQQEPKKALYGGKDGLVYHKKIIEYSRNFLKEGGYLIMEISPEQRSFFLNTDFSPLKILEIKKDFCGLDRVVIFKKNVKILYGFF